MLQKICGPTYWWWKGRRYNLLVIDFQYNAFSKDYLGQPGEYSNTFGQNGCHDGPPPSVQNYICKRFHDKIAILKKMSYIREVDEKFVKQFLGSPTETLLIPTADIKFVNIIEENQSWIFSGRSLRLSRTTRHIASQQRPLPLDGVLHARWTQMYLMQWKLNSPSPQLDAQPGQTGYCPPGQYSAGIGGILWNTHYIFFWCSHR